MITLSERFDANRCSGWERGRCKHGFPGTRFCIGSLDPVRMFAAAKPQCCDEEWPAQGIAARSDETRSGSAVGKSPVPTGCAHPLSPSTPSPKEDK